MFLWVIFLEVELLDQRVYMFFILLEIAKPLSTDFVPIYIQISNERACFSCPYQHNLLSNFLIFANLIIKSAISM